MVNFGAPVTQMIRLGGGVPPIDFDRQDLGDVLRSYGQRPEEKTFFIWEGVTQYLTETSVRQTFAYLAKAPMGGRPVFTYVQKAFLDGTSRFGLSAHSQVVRIKEQLWRFGLAPDQVATFLAE